jgi:transcriptional regulator with XRE-family HTH domain
MPANREFDALYEEIGQRVAQARAAAGLSQAKLAGLIKMSRTSVVNIEQGRQRLPIHQLWQLADALELEVGQFLPLRRELAERGAPVQLDATVVALIEEAAQNDPNTKRRLQDFIQEAKTKIASEPVPLETPRSTRGNSPSRYRRHS